MTEATRQWRAWQQAPWGRLRYTQANANLARHLPPAPATVLDLAGGDGANALRPARQGHDVTVVDRSAGMLAEAEHAFAQAGLPVRLVRADLADLPGSVRGPHDAVLAHNVIQYLPDPAFFADLERLELALADRMPYPLLARFFHLVLRRGNPDDGEAGIS